MPFSLSRFHLLRHTKSPKHSHSAVRFRALTRTQNTCYLTHRQPQETVHTLTLKHTVKDTWMVKRGIQRKCTAGLDLGIGSVLCVCVCVSMLCPFHIVAAAYRGQFQQGKRKATNTSLANATSYTGTLRVERFTDSNNKLRNLNRSLHR